MISSSPLLCIGHLEHVPTGDLAGMHQLVHLVQLLELDGLEGGVDQATGVAGPPPTKCLNSRCLRYPLFLSQRNSYACYPHVTSTAGPMSGATTEDDDCPVARQDL